MNHLIIGCGYVGLQVAQALLAQRERVSALTRSAAHVAEWQTLGIQGIQGDLDNAAPFPAFKESWDCVHYYAPPPPSGESDPRIEAALAQLSAYPPKRLVLISTTGTYGDCQGAWITEAQPLNPQADRSKRRVAAERSAQTWADKHQVDLVILRVPGIYGPQRVPVKRIEKGVPMLDASIAPYSNRIHVHDLVRACLAASQAATATGIYHVSDGNPSTMTDYFNQIADAVGLPCPPSLTWEEAQAQLSPEMMSYLSESKRLDITKMRTELGVEPDYPDLASGLRQALS